MNETTITTLLFALRVVTLVLGALIAAISVRAYHRTRARSLLALSVGFGLITLGTVLAGIVHQFFGAPFETGLLVESALLAGGFLCVAFSLYTRS